MLRVYRERLKMALACRALMLRVYCERLRVALEGL